MAYQPHVSITASGTLGDPASPSEIFSVRLNAGIALQAGTPPLDVEGLAQIATATRPGWTTLIGGLCTNQVQVTRIRAAFVGLDGKIPRDAQGRYRQGDATGAPIVGGGSAAVPFQLALVIGLKTAFAGPTGMGRIYLPCPASGVSKDGRQSTTTVAAELTPAVNALTQIRNALGSSLTGLVVASQGSASKGLPPANHTITGVRIGRVLDTQRRRRNALLEEYVTQALA
jgi:hypothetical protein